MKSHSASGKLLFSSLLKGLVLSLWLQLAFVAELSAQSGDDYTTTIPVRIVQGLMFADVVIDGETFNFLIDTGAPFVLSPEVADRLDFDQKSSTSIGSSNNRRGTGRIGTIPHKVELGGLKFSGFQVLVVDYNANTELIRCLDFDGILGANFMEGSIWHFNYDEQKVLITNELKNVPRIRDTWRTKMREEGFGNSPHIPAGVNNGKKGYILFDTGYSGFFDLPYRSYYKAVRAGKPLKGFKKLKGFGTMSEGVFGAEDTTGYYLQTPTITIGKEVIKQPTFEMSHSDDTKVGVFYMKGRLVTFDFKDEKFYVYEKEAPFYSTNISEYMLTFALDNGTIRIGTLYGSLLDEGELQVGDYLVSVDQKQVKEMDSCETIMWLRTQLRERQTPMEIQVERNGRLIDYTLRRKPVFQE